MKFYGRRLKRTLPSYIPFILINFAGMVAIHRPDPFSLIQELCGNFSLLGRVNGLDHQTNWYMPAILWFYLFAPLFYRIITDYSGKKQIRHILSLVAFVILINVTFFGNYFVLIGVSRIFVFLIDMIFACLGSKKINDKTLTVFSVICLLVGIGITFLTQRYFKSGLKTYGLDWYPFIIIAPSASIVSGKIFSAFEKFRIGRTLNKAFSFIGKNSFEIYLFHMTVFPIATTILKKISNPMWVGLAIFGIAGGFIYNYAVTYITKKIQNKNRG